MARWQCHCRTRWARATYRLVGKVFVYGGFESAQEAYLLADRENLSD
jgi:hypothetical protein